MSIAVYWESWNTNDMSTVPATVGIVYLAFADPNTTYTSGQKTFTGTGLDFSSSFATIQTQISTLKAKGTKVILSVGGSDLFYPANFNAKSVVAFMTDLGCQGCDIDWEPADGVASSAQFGPIIAAYRAVNSTMYLTAACFSVGAFGPQSGQTFYGMNIPGIESNGNQLSWINIMVI